ncbi:hypothetical protein LJ707_07890 [Mucilaginibacter sp. UR6-1]|uniref:hypothetical protein n=1 Tax=Mucilaginibacter sp. UR6-1 TaxID=1435643 RepID=UPI001E3D3E45|nr:hypothetical protein [Mucilaginibacter sp. UR6-1]MCC8408847.1 hypothetical protein [Mucilaginibacter sp. UR6-1]
MAKNIILSINIMLLFLITGCTGDLKPENLRGKWKYVKVFNPKANPPDSVSTMQLEELKPYIEFTGNNKLQIVWNGKVLSKGTYHIEAHNIRFKEELSEGQTREFPFYVSKLTEKEIVFETMGSDGSRVTAVRE